MSRIHLSLILIVLGGCPAQSEDVPTDLSTTGDESTGSATLTTSVTSVDTTATTSPETTGSTDTTDGPDDTTTTGGPECLGEDDCWNCTPTNANQLRNHCTDAECSPFDNVARLPLLHRDGTLPPLP